MAPRGLAPRGDLERAFGIHRGSSRRREGALARLRVQFQGALPLAPEIVLLHPQENVLPGKQLLVGARAADVVLAVDAGVTERRLPVAAVAVRFEKRLGD